MTDALILVDLQHDFLEGGALPVAGGEAVVPIANRLMPRFEHVVATQDFHPAAHGSFATHHPGKRPGDMIDLHGLPQVLWPPHCVAGTRGAALADDLDAAHVEAVFRKGEDPSVDSYSGFFDNGRRRDTGLAAWLAERGVRRVYVMGLATDYCVKYTALDALALGLETYVIEDGCRGVELAPGDVERALAELEAKGAKRVRSDDSSLGARIDP